MRHHNMNRNSRWNLDALCGMLVLAAVPLLVTSCTLTKLIGIGGPSSYSSGERSGRVVKLSERGLIFKTWEGELAVGAVRAKRTEDGTSSVPVVFEFSVTDPVIVQQIREAQRADRVVTLQYGQPYVMSWRDGSSGSIVTGVAP